MLRKIKKNEFIILNQIRTKLLLKNLYNVPTLKNTNLTINLLKLKSFNDDSILEGLFLLEFLTALRGNISYYKKAYQEVTIQINTYLRHSMSFYFLILLKVFYFPIIIRRGLGVTESFDKLLNYNFTLNDINFFPFLPDIYFKWDKPINCFFYFKNIKNKSSKLYLQY